MPTPRVVGVEPAELPGAYRANMDDGSSMLLHGPSGEALARRYASTGENAMGPNALALNDQPPGTPQQVSDAPAGPYKLPGGGAAIKLSDLKKTAEQGRANAAARESGQPVPFPAQQSPASTTATTAPQQSAAPAAQAGPLGYTMKGIDPATGKPVEGAAYRNADGSIGIMVPGSKGSPGGLTKAGTNELEQNTAAEKEHSKQEALAEIARQRGVDAALDESAERQGYLIEQQNRLINEAKQQQDEVDKQQAAVDKLQAGYQAARDDFMNSKVDPDQYMKADKGRALFSMLGVALSQFGSVFTRQPNIAAEFVNSQIDRNIRAQEAAINVKGKAADNMLADLTRSTGDLKLAKIAMKQMLTERAAMQAEQVSLGAKDAGIKANSQAVAAALAGDAALQGHARNRAEVEHVFGDKSGLYYRKGVAGSAPRMALPTQDAVQSAEGAGIKKRELDLAEAKAKADAAKAKAGGNVPDAVKKQLAELDAAIAGIDRMESHEKGETIYRTGGGLGASTEAKQLASDASSVGPGVARAIEGDAATKDSMDAAKSGLAAHDAEQRAAARASYREQLIEKRKQVLSNQ